MNLMRAVGLAYSGMSYDEIAYYRIIVYNECSLSRCDRCDCIYKPLFIDQRHDTESVNCECHFCAAWLVVISVPHG